MTARATTSLLINPPKNSHIALFYDDRIDLERTVADYINIGLARRQLCVYATIRHRDEQHLERIYRLITDYAENIEKGNLLVVDLASYYLSALLGEMKPFDEAKKLFAKKASERADNHVRFVGDATGFLFKNRHFDECAMVEQWWQEKPFEGSYLCPYLRTPFETSPHDLHANRAVLATHDIVINISGTPIKEQYSHTNIDLENENATAKLDMSKWGVQ